MERSGMLNVRDNESAHRYSDWFISFRWIVTIFTITLLTACNSIPDANSGSGVFSNSVTLHQNEKTVKVGKNIKYVLIFGITPDANGEVQRVRLTDVMDRNKQKISSFHPSKTFMANVEKHFRRRQWSVFRTNDMKIKEVYDFCLYSPVIPDKPVCRIVQ